MQKTVLTVKSGTIPLLVVMGYSELYWAVPGCSGLYWALLECTGLYWTVLGCTGLYWAVLRCTRLLSICPCQIGFHHSPISHLHHLSVSAPLEVIFTEPSKAQCKIEFTYPSFVPLCWQKSDTSQDALKLIPEGPN